MTEWIVLIIPWLFVSNVLLYGTLAAGSYMRGRRKQFMLFGWAAIGFAIGAGLLLW